ncbi:uncharacterized protein LOC132180551 [Corylus avellana]|uniref:uncharacterized protein LOC132180551 n=1 Tax=Corylus avellana TaxID=13451 RepID=UPI00286CE799|nr:uncharacterized protein LOC132180551 [Corylus avellana]
MGEWGPDNPDYIYQHWYDTLEQSYDPTIDPDADVGDVSDDDGMDGDGTDDVMSDLTLYEMELKIMGLQLELHELKSRLKATYIALCNTLEQNGLLRHTRAVQVTKQLATFCLVMSQGLSCRSVADRLQRSTYFVSVYVRKSARALCQLGKSILQPNPVPLPHPNVANNAMYYPWFADCIGTIDGTQIDARVSNKKHIHYRGRKCTTTQNVMCVVDLDLCFTYVYARWEGSTHDARIFTMCVSDSMLKFPTPVGDAYYLVDSGYGLYRGFLTPFRRERYHLQEWQDGGLPINQREGFNRRHASLRSVVERAFGVLKNRFPIMRKMPSYPIWYQRLFVIACCTIHNFIQKHYGVEDKLFKEALKGLNPWVDVTVLQQGAVVPYISSGLRPNQSSDSTRYMGKIRDVLARHMWEHGTFE